MAKLCIRNQVWFTHCELKVKSRDEKPNFLTYQSLEIWASVKNREQKQLLKPVGSFIEGLCYKKCNHDYRRSINEIFLVFFRMAATPNMWQQFTEALHIVAIQSDDSHTLMYENSHKNWIKNWWGMLKIAKADACLEINVKMGFKKQFNWRERSFELQWAFLENVDEMCQYLLDSVQSRAAGVKNWDFPETKKFNDFDCSEEWETRGANAGKAGERKRLLGVE